jgi:hypothetical protein
VGQGQLWTALNDKERKDYAEAILRELRREAGPLNARGQFALNPGIKSDEGKRNAADDE